MARLAFLRRANHLRERSDQRRGIVPPFVNALAGQARKNRLPATGEVHDDVAPVGPRTDPPQQLPLLQAIHQFHHAVMAEAHALGQRADRGLAAQRQPAQDPKKHVLLGLEMDVARRLLASAEKNADLVPKFRQRTAFRRIEGRLP